MTNEIIRINNMSKSFGQTQVLNKVNLTVKAGQSVALVGNNGSGKSTLLRIICGLTNITSGEIKYSKDLKFNYVPEHFPKMNITARQYIKHMGLIEGVSEHDINENSQQLFQTFFMGNMVDTPMKNLSKGTLQKVSVIQAFLSRPDILLLDEPLSGQDVQSQKKFIKLVRELNQQGVTIIMSCHEMFLVNQISNIAYEIKNQGLEPFIISKTNEYEYDVLVFENNGRQINMNTDITRMIEKIDYYQDEIKLIIPREKSNEIIMHMLRDDFILREMKGIDE